MIIITALPFDFATRRSAAEMQTFTENELNEVQAWVKNGGSLLVFSEHAPFDQAINPLLKKFEIESSVGVTIDTLNYDKSYNSRMIVFKGENLQETYDYLVSHKEKVKYYNFTYGLLKDGGVKTKIIKKYLPLINQQVNRYLQMMDFYINFTLDEEFNETIQSPIHEDFSYASFSEGEKQRIDLALLFTWREVAKFNF